MSERITRRSLDEAVREDRTDWARVRNLTDEEIDTAVAADPDSWAITDEELANAPVWTFVVFKSSDGSWRWSLRDAAGQAVAEASHGELSRRDAEAKLDEVRRAFFAARLAA